MHEPAVNALTGSEQVMDFFAIALKDSALLERLMASIDAKDDAAMIGIANEYGYSFDTASLHQGLKKIFNLIKPTVLVEGLDTFE